MMQDPVLKHYCFYSVIRHNNQMPKYLKVPSFKRKLVCNKLQIVPTAYIVIEIENLTDFLMSHTIHFHKWTLFFYVVNIVKLLHVPNNENQQNH